MEQIHDILINRFFTGSTSATTIVTTQSDLKYENSYYYNPIGTPDIIVDYSNVRAFLSNENNQKFVQEYYSFLTSSTLMNSAILADPNTTLFIPTAAFKEIYYDDEKLAESYNNFYNSSLLRGLDTNYISNPDITNTSLKNLLLSDGVNQLITQNVFHNYYFWQSSIPANPAYSPPKNPFFTAGTPYYTSPPLDVYGGDRDESAEERLVEIPINKENYYVNVLLLKRFTQTARMAFETCNNVIYKTINSTNTLSQNPTDTIRYNDFVTTSNTRLTSNLDGSQIVTIQQSYDKALQENFTQSTIDISESELQTGKTYLQCFVDPNFKTNENEYWTDIKANYVRFEHSSYSLPIGNTIGVKVILQHPAEEYVTVEVKIVNETANSYYDYNILSPFHTLETNKYITVYFNEGESVKTIYFENSYTSYEIGTEEVGKTLPIPQSENSNVNILGEISGGTSNAKTFVIQPSQIDTATTLENSSMRFATIEDLNTITSSTTFINTTYTPPNNDYIEVNNLTEIATSLTDAGFKLGGAYGLSKQGYVFRSKFKDLDFFVTKNNETSILVVPYEIIIENFIPDSIPSQLKTFLSYIFATRIKVSKIKKQFSTKTDLINVWYSIYTDYGVIELFFYNNSFKVNLLMPELVDYTEILTLKSLVARPKDLNDVELFVPYATPLRINQNSIINASSEYAKSITINQSTLKTYTITTIDTKNILLTLSNSYGGLLIGNISSTNIATERYQVQYETETEPEPASEVTQASQTQQVQTEEVMTWGSEPDPPEGGDSQSEQTQGGDSGGDSGDGGDY